MVMQTARLCIWCRLADRASCCTAKAIGQHDGATAQETAEFSLRGMLSAMN